MSQKNIISMGFMSGTSCDGVDIALIKTDGQAYTHTLATDFIAYPKIFRDQLKAAQYAAQRCHGDISQIDAQLKTHALLKAHKAPLEYLKSKITDYFIQAARHLPADLPKPSVIGCHGQTLFHNPTQAHTYQLCDPALLSQSLNTEVLANFRQDDMAAGGQGAPIAPIYHYALSQANSCTPTAWVNIGGISNVTIIPNEHPEQMTAFDAGPGNQLIDRFIALKTGGCHQYDENGQFGRKGSIKRDIIDTCLKAYQPALMRPMPRAFDACDFPTLDIFNLWSLEHGARSLATLTAEIISTCIARCKVRPKTWVVSGGGAYNPCIMEALSNEARKQEAYVIQTDILGHHSDFIEAELMAYIAVRQKHGLPITYPGTTGRHAEAKEATHTNSSSLYSAT